MDKSLNVWSKVLEELGSDIGNFVQPSFESFKKTGLLSIILFGKKKCFSYYLIFDF